MPIENVLVVGGGPAGMVAALALSRQGAAVDLVEIGDGFGAAGIGVNLQNSPLRALSALGLLDAVVARGHRTDVVNLLDAAGRPIAPALRPPTLVPGTPASVGISRAVLAEILAAELERTPVRVRFGMSVAAVADETDAAAVVFTDGTAGRYDLVVGADGLHSRIRSLVHGDVAPVYSGQCIWRGAARRGDVDEYQLLHAPRTKLGLVPLSAEGMYVYVVAPFDAPPRRGDPAASDAAFLAAVAEFAGPAAGVADRIEPGADFRALTSLILDPPWHRGRVLVIGDAAHATTPHLSYGLGLAIEDGIVLAELVGTGREAPEVLDAFQERRLERCRVVVHNSRQLSAWEQDPPADRSLHTALMRASIDVLSAAL